MAKDKVGTNRGQWYVECGKLDSGKQPRLYLGHTSEVSEDEARVRRHRVRQFWQRFRLHNRLNGYPLARQVEGVLCDTWSERALGYAKQIGKGVTRLVYEKPGTAPMLVEAIADLNRHYEGVVTFVADEARHEPLRAVRDEARATFVTAHRAIEVSPIDDDGSEPLHYWLDRFSEYARRTKQTHNEDTGALETSEWGHQFSKQVAHLKRYVPDVPLSKLDYPAIEAACITLANRPISKKSGKPIALKYASTLLKVWKAFIRWLPKQAAWRKPEEWDEAFSSHRPKRTTSEKEAGAIGKVAAYTAEQLRAIYKYATPYERVLFLLAINCGFGAMELSLLAHGQCFVDTGDSYIKRVRTKSAAGVYGEHWLFPQTAEAVEWSRARTAAILNRPLAARDPVIVRDSGERLVKVIQESGNRSNKAANAWQRLTKRIRREQPEFPELSFGKLRKTAGNLLKGFSDGETVAVFHQRSSAVPTDDESEVYTDRDYARVFAAQKQVYELLRPVLESEPRPFGSVRKVCKSHNTISRIKQLWADGIKPEQIAEMTGTSRATAYRYRPSA